MVIRIHVDGKDIHLKGHAFLGPINFLMDLNIAKYIYLHEVWI
jgi:hypothetical protein